MRALVATILAVMALLSAGVAIASPAIDPLDLLRPTTRPAESQPDRAGSGSVRPAATQPVPAVTVAVIIPLTGPLAPFGQSARRGLELAAGRLDDEASSTQPAVRLIMFDSQSRALQSAGLARKAAIIQKADVIIGGLDGPSALAIKPVAQQNRVLFIVLGGGYRPLAGEEQFVCRIGISQAQLVDGLARHARQELGKSRLFVVADGSSDQSILDGDGFASAFRRFGGEVIAVASAAARSGPGRLQEIAGQASDGQADAVFAALPPASLATFATAFRKRFADAPLLAAPTDWELAALLADPAVAIRRTLVAVPFAHDDTDARLQAWLNEFSTAFPQDRPDVAAAVAYDSLLLVRHLARRRQLAGGDLHARLAGLAYLPGVLGPMSLTKDGVIDRPVTIGQLVSDAGRLRVKFVRRAGQPATTQPAKK